MATLTDADLCRFARDGYLVVSGAVPEPLLAAADAEIGLLIDEVAPQEGTGGPGQNAWFQPRVRLPRCEDVLRQSAVLQIAEELVAPQSLNLAFDQIQVAITVSPYSHIPGGPHIDGHRPDQDPPYSFTMLAGVLLTDQSTPQSGNLWVWPGSHLDHSALFRERGTRVLQQTSGHVHRLEPRPVRPVLARRVEVMGKRGDLVLAHFLLGHNKGGNMASHVRRTIYYRLAVSGHVERWESTFLDPWTEYAPVRDALAR
jgi:ectoine hydroxylase-related dioxygenase (phytanoyl-CoA dioxygenase family)